MILLDTSLLFAVFNEEDQNHQKARDIFRRIFKGDYAQPVLIDHVYDELLTLTFVRTKDFENCIRVSGLIHDFVETRSITFMHTPSETYWKANKIFLEQELENQTRFLSFTDAVIGAMASWLNATHIGTFDHQFHRFSQNIVAE